MTSSLSSADNTFESSAGVNQLSSGEHPQKASHTQSAARIAAFRESIGRILPIVDIQDAPSFIRSGCEPRVGTASLVVSARSVRDITDVLKGAAAHQLTVHPVSGGQNWGYGGANPLGQADVLLDLREMNAILELNEEFAYVVVEPGVTQEQLYDFLKLRAPSLAMDACGAPPQASFVGNILERGFGYNRQCDHFSQSCAYEVVLPDGTLLRTGLSRFAHCRTRYLTPVSLGPSMEGLFAQSNYGIVTKLCIWLTPKPERLFAYSIRLHGDEAAGKAVELLRDLKLRNSIEGAPHLFNDVRSLAVWNKSPAATSGRSLSPRELQELREGGNVSEWTVVGGIWGSESECALTKETLKQAFSGFAAIEFLDCSKWENSDSSLIDERFKLIAGLIGGRASKRPSAGMYWANPHRDYSQHADPIEDQCGLLWFVPTIPARQADVVEFLEHLRSTVRRFDFDTSLALTMPYDRACIATVSISFDRTKAAESERATALHRELVRTCFEKGFIPYRFGTGGAAGAEYFATGDAFTEVTTRLKEVFDPERILSPGRYGIA